MPILYIVLAFLAALAAPAHAQEVYRRTGPAMLSFATTSNIPIVGQFIGSSETHKITGFMRHRSDAYAKELPWIFMGVAYRKDTGRCSFRTEADDVGPDMRGVVFVNDAGKPILIRGQVLSFPCVPFR